MAVMRYQKATKVLGIEDICERDISCNDCPILSFTETLDIHNWPGRVICSSG